MKLFLIVINLFVMSLNVNGQQFINNLVILSEKGKQFTLYVNDEKINPIPEAIVKAFNLGKGWQKIKIEFGEGKDSSLKDSVCIKAFEKNVNKELTYKIVEELTNNKLKYKLVFVSESDFSGPKSPNVPDAPVEKVMVVDNNLYGNLYQAKDNKPIFFKNYNEETKQCEVKLTDDEIQFAINLFNKTTDMADKFMNVDISIERNCYSTEQLIKLLNLYEIEMEKLKMARKAYWHLTDRNNAANLSKSFKFDAIKSQYQVFLKDVANESKQINLKCITPTAEKEFDLIFSNLNKIRDDYEKIKVAKKYVIENCFNTIQIAKIMDLFSHDREKMEFAYAAQEVVTDKENLAKLAEAIQFGENKKEFLKIISK